MLMTQTMPINYLKSLSNPITWVSLVVIALVIGLLFFSERGQNNTVRLEFGQAADQGVINQGEIERRLLPAPGAMARELIADERAKGRPYNLTALHTQAELFYVQGNLADAHILYFFCARERFLPSMLKMAEMSDPRLFNNADSLLDHPDGYQAWKWYQLSSEAGSELAKRRLDDLRDWARAEAALGNQQARVLLLNYR